MSRLIAKVAFLQGTLVAEGLLDPPSYAEIEIPTVAAKDKWNKVLSPVTEYIELKARLGKYGSDLLNGESTPLTTPFKLQIKMNELTPKETVTLSSPTSLNDYGIKILTIPTTTEDGQPVRKNIDVVVGKLLEKEKDPKLTEEQRAAISKADKGMDGKEDVHVSKMIDDFIGSLAQLVKKEVTGASSKTLKPNFQSYVTEVAKSLWETHEAVNFVDGYPMDVADQIARYNGEKNGHEIVRKAKEEYIARALENWKITPNLPNKINMRSAPKSITDPTSLEGEKRYQKILRYLHTDTVIESDTDLDATAFTVNIWHSAKDRIENDALGFVRPPTVGETSSFLDKKSMNPFLREKYVQMFTLMASFIEKLGQAPEEYSIHPYTPKTGPVAYHRLIAEILLFTNIVSNETEADAAALNLHKLLLSRSEDDRELIMGTGEKSLMAIDAKHRAQIGADKTKKETSAKPAFKVYAEKIFSIALNPPPGIQTAYEAAYVKGLTKHDALMFIGQGENSIGHVALHDETIPAWGVGSVKHPRKSIETRYSINIPRPEKVGTIRRVIKRVKRVIDWRIKRVAEIPVPEKFPAREAVMSQLTKLKIVLSDFARVYPAPGKADKTTLARAKAAATKRISSILGDLEKSGLTLCEEAIQKDLCENLVSFSMQFRYLRESLNALSQNDDGLEPEGVDPEPLTAGPNGRNGSDPNGNALSKNPVGFGSVIVMVLAASVVF